MATKMTNGEEHVHVKMMRAHVRGARINIPLYLKPIYTNFSIRVYLTRILQFDEQLKRIL